jgi:hypothetical protein
VARLRTIAFCYVAPCSLVEVDSLLAGDYTALYIRKLKSSSPNRYMI